MAIYHYKAINAQGSGFNGVMDAPDESVLEQQLELLGYYLIEIQKNQKKQKTSNDTALPRAELSEFFSALQSLLGAGITLAGALEAIIEESENEKFKTILLDIKVNVEAGNTLEASMRLYPKAFDTQIVSLINAGEYSGNLESSCHDISVHLDWLDNLIHDIKQASIYPIMVILAVFILLMIMFAFVVPRFSLVFQSLDIDVPVLTKAILAMGEFAQSYWLIIIGLIFFVFISANLFIKSVPRAKLWFDHIKLRLPVFGELNAMIVQSRLCHNLALLLRSGVPILEALKLCQQLVGNRVVALNLEHTLQAVSDGLRMSETLRKSGIFSPIVLRMIVVGEETGRLDEALQYASERFDKALPRKIKRLFSILEPCIMFVLIAIVGVLAAAIFLPMLSIMAGLN